MGMYTELVCAFDLKKDVPKNVVNVLKYMVSENEAIQFTPPEHQLFSTERWEFMLNCDSFYFPGKANTQIWFDAISGWGMSIRCNLKNYNDEIQKFIDWIKPYMNTYGFFGYMRYECADEPTLLYND